MEKLKKNAARIKRILAALIVVGLISVAITFFLEFSSRKEEVKMANGNFTWLPETVSQIQSGLKSLAPALTAGQDIRDDLKPENCTRFSAQWTPKSIEIELKLDYSEVNPYLPQGILKVHKTLGPDSEVYDYGVYESVDTVKKAVERKVANEAAIGCLEVSTVVAIIIFLAFELILRLRNLLLRVLTLKKEEGMED